MQGRFAKSYSKEKKEASKKKRGRRNHNRKSGCFEFERHAPANGGTVARNRASGRRESSRRSNRFSRQVSSNDAADEARRRDVAGNVCDEFLPISIGLPTSNGNCWKSLFLSLVGRGKFVLNPTAWFYFSLPLQSGNVRDNFFSCPIFAHFANYVQVLSFCKRSLLIS